MSGFEPELRISSQWVFATLIVIATIVLFASEDVADLHHRSQVQLLGVLLCALPSIAWLLECWRPWVGRWFVVIALATVIVLAHQWLGVPGTSALLRCRLVWLQL